VASGIYCGTPNTARCPCTSVHGIEQRWPYSISRTLLVRFAQVICNKMAESAGYVLTGIWAVLLPYAWLDEYRQGSCLSCHLSAAVETRLAGHPWYSVTCCGNRGRSFKSHAHSSSSGNLRRFLHSLAVNTVHRSRHCVYWEMFGLPTDSVAGILLTQSCGKAFTDSPAPDWPIDAITKWT
jgi:hypothetical protein